MNVYESVRTKREIRFFQDKAIPDEVLKKILQAGRLSPSSKNAQPWHFIVIKNKETLKELSTTSPTAAHLARTPLAIAILMDQAKLPGVDSARAVESMALTAWEEGIGTCWITNFDEERVKTILGIPEEIDLLTVMPFGYPTEPKPSGGKKRKPLREIAHHERFGEPYQF